VSKRKGIVISMLLVALMVGILVGVRASAVVVQAGEVAEPPIDPIKSLSLTHLDVDVRAEGVVGILELRTFAEGLSFRDIEAIRADVTEMARAAGIPGVGAAADAGEAAYVAAREAREIAAFKAEGCRVVVYGYVIGPDGVVAGKRVVGNDHEQVVRAAHQDALEWFKKIIAAPLMRNAPCPITGQANNQWQWVYQRNEQRAVNPYGRITNNVALHRLVAETCPTHNHYHVRQFFATEPGHLLWVTPWKNRNKGLRHEWRAPTVHSLSSWSPLATVSGSQIFSVSLGPSPAATWSFYHPAVTTLSLGVPNPLIRRWDQNYSAWPLWCPVAKTVGGMEPGSRPLTLQQPAGSGRRFLGWICAWGYFRRCPQWTQISPVVSAPSVPLWTISY
jgi:hypothetical protein